MAGPERILRELTRPQDPLPVPEWCARHFQLDKTSPIQGRYNPNVSPWLNQPLRDFQNPRIGYLFCRAGAQTGKTQLAICALTWAVAEEPGPAMWVLPAADECKTFARTRLKDSWEKTEPVARLLPSDRSDNALLEVNFATMPFLLTGANSGSKLTGKPLRYVFGDEIKDWPPGTWAVVRKRVTAWLGLSKVFGFSTPYFAGDDVDEGFKEGDQNFWYMDCPHCGQGQHLEWSQVEWDKVKTEDGRYDYPRIFPTIRIQCKACKVPMVRDSYHERVALLRSGRWIAHNPAAPEGKRSYAWNALINPRIPLAELVEEYLRAKEAETQGVLKPLQDFYNQRLALGWDDWVGQGKPVNQEEYDPAEKWPDEFVRFCTVDVQILGIFYALVWQWAKGGRARYVAAQECHSWAEVREFQTTHQVKDKLTFVDFGHEQTSVFAECVRYGWRAFRGQDKEFFFWRTKDKKTIRRIVSPPFPCDPAVGTSFQGKRGLAEGYYWSNDQIKDIVKRLIDGRQFLMPEDVPEMFIQHLNSETKRKDEKGRWKWERIGKRPNHLWDCACMQVAAAVLGNILKDVVTVKLATSPAP
jgi:phage terminase large subunit GpA-like protein